MPLTFYVVVYLTNGLLGTKCLLCAGTVKVKDGSFPSLLILYAALRITSKEMKAVMWSFSMKEK